MNEQPVIVRAYSGVFFGFLLERNGNNVELRDARQVWSWDSKGLKEPVNTCADIAVRGVGDGSRVSSPAPRAFISQVGAMFHCTDEAVKVFAEAKWTAR